MRGPRNYSNQQSKSKTKEAVTFLLIGPESVGINIPYGLATWEFKTLIKGTFGAIWNMEFKLWEISLNHYKQCLSEVRQFMTREGRQQAPYINKIPDFVLKAKQEMSLDLQIKNSAYSVVKEIKYSQLETSIQPRALPFYYKLYDFQKESLDFGIQRHGRLLLADEMGVGKTIQSLAIASIYRHEWPFLVICPSSLRLNWQQETITWLGDYIKKTEIQVYNKGGTPIRQTAKVLIISYDLAWKIRDVLQYFKVVIVDEAHYLKNSGNKRSDILTPFLSSRKRIILLSGTPALAKPRQIFNLISIIRPDLYTHFKEFGYRYCQPTMNHWSRQMDFNGCQNAKELHYLISNKVMIRRLKRDVLTQLPDKQRQKIIVETDKSVIKEIKELLSTGVGGDVNNMNNVVMDMLHQFDSHSPEGQDTRMKIMLAYTLTGKAKLNAIKEYVLELLNNDTKLIIFAHHMLVLDGLEQAIVEKKIKYMRIDGHVTKEKRHDNVVNFQEDASIRVALLSISAAGVGLTLTAASTVVFAQLHWTPGMMVQAEDRAHRIGQKSSVNCHYLIGENTLDDILYRNLEKKINNVSSFVEGRIQQLDIQNLSKGEKGKVSAPTEDSHGSGMRESGILFKFESIKPIVDKYSSSQQESDISLEGTNFNSESDIENSQTSKFKPKSKKSRKGTKGTKGTKGKKGKKEVMLLEEPQTILETEMCQKEEESPETSEIKDICIKERETISRRKSEIVNDLLQNDEEDKGQREKKESSHKKEDEEQDPAEHRKRTDLYQLILANSSSSCMADSQRQQQSDQTRSLH